MRSEVKLVSIRALCQVANVILFVLFIVTHADGDPGLIRFIVVLVLLFVVTIAVQLTTLRCCRDRRPCTCVGRVGHGCTEVVFFESCVAGWRSER